MRTISSDACTLKTAYLPLRIGILVQIDVLKWSTPVSVIAIHPLEEYVSILVRNDYTVTQ